MSNMLLNLLGQRPQEPTPLQQIAQTLKAASDPIGELNQMARTDPRMQQVSEVIRKNGGVKQAVYALAKEKGVDPNVILKQAQMFR